MSADVEGPPSLLVEGLAFAYPDGRQVLFGVDLAVAPGERVALLGPNGAGKTTLVLHLVGVLGAVAGGTGAGRVVVGGLELARRTLPEVRRRVGVVLQDPDDQLFLPTVGDDVAFGPANAGLRGEDLRDRVDRALADVALGDVADRAPHHLSQGQRRRAALATVLATDPEVLVLDEPTANLDPAGRRELADVLAALATTQLVVTHDLSFALQMCPRAVLLDEGRVVADGPTRDLLSDDALLRAHRLELPFGLDPRALPPG
ncbi:ABC transporter ATP-binding protein [Pseudokineococcus marinus]|uniref:ABC transporter ATP-binding protein n=1 Tax=Pseudokineococcus marinus TaxID=351215 RepID=A0A849BMY7_9ACTN|nr:ABC transporter ATP-binding protein [Pseudokineococcus marinus]NNH22407.1 ABC transporter ATP-binding protein [Pseudokineococcus marinus]